MLLIANDALLPNLSCANSAEIDFAPAPKDPNRSYAPPNIFVQD